MDKIKLLETRKKQLNDAGKSIRADIAELTDKDSFVELSAFSFHENSFYGNAPEGEGVVTGFATIDGYPYYIVAQNGACLSGGVSLEGCRKMKKCLDAAASSSTPVIYILCSRGVQIGEGVNVLEGVASLLSAVSALRGKVPQYLVVNGEVYGQISLLAAMTDFNFFVDGKSFLALSSPFVLSAPNGMGIDKAKVASADALDKTGLVSFKVASLSEVREKITSIAATIATPVTDVDENALNADFKKLNKNADSEGMIRVLDEGSRVEIGASTAQEIRCFLGRIGGIAIAAIVFSEDGGVRVNERVMEKITGFVSLAEALSLPLVFFVDALGVEETVNVNNSPVFSRVSDYVGALKKHSHGKISVVYGNAVGLGYTLFSAKSMGFDAVYAFADAKVALFDCPRGAEIEFRDYEADKAELEKRYSDENSDPVNAARGGYVDNIIEPAHVKKYLVASLQMLVR